MCTNDLVSLPRRFFFTLQHGLLFYRKIEFETTEQSSYSCSQLSKSSWILWKPKCHYLSAKPPLLPILNKTSHVHAPCLEFFNMHFNVTPPSTPRYLKLQYFLHVFHTSSMDFSSPICDRCPFTFFFLDLIILTILVRSANHETSHYAVLSIFLPLWTNCFPHHPVSNSNAQHIY